MSTPLTAWIRRHPLGGYFLVAYIVTWVGVSPLVAEALGYLGTPLPPSLHVLGALGPLAAALIVTWVVGGLAGVAELGRRITRWRVGVRWWMAALSPLGLVLIAAASLRAFGRPWPDLAPLSTALGTPSWMAHLLIASLAYGVFEETGWRGFALPRLQYNHGALTATLILAVLWGLWHLPFFTYLYRLDGVSAYVGFYLCFVAGAVWLTFLYNSSGGSVLMPILWHITWNLVNLACATVSPDLVMVINILLLPIAVLALTIGGAGRLSLSEKHTVATPPLLETGAYPQP